MRANKQMILPFAEPTPRLYRGRHTKKCVCYPCLRRKTDLIEEKLRQLEGVPRPRGTYAIPVKAHWRRTSRPKNVGPMQHILQQMIAEIDRLNGDDESSRRLRSR